MEKIERIRLCGASHVGETRERNEDAFLIGQAVERTAMIGACVESMSRSHPRRNEILKCLGAGRDCEPEVAVLEQDEVLAGDSLLICGDGLWEMLDAEIVAEEFQVLQDLFERIGNRQASLEKLENALRAVADGFSREPGIDEIAGDVLAQTKSHLLGIFGKRETDVPLAEMISERLRENSEARQSALAELLAQLDRFQTDLKDWRKTLSSFLINREENPIETILRREATIESKMAALIDAANARISKDNATAVLIEFE